MSFKDSFRDRYKTSPGLVAMVNEVEKAALEVTDTTLDQATLAVCELSLWCQIMENDPTKAMSEAIQLALFVHTVKLEFGYKAALHNVVEKLRTRWAFSSDTVVH